MFITEQKKTREDFYWYAANKALY